MYIIIHELHISLSNLGVLLLNENKGNEMIEILQHLQKCVPKIHCTDTIFIPSTQRSVSKIKIKQHRIVFSGDQLTVARMMGAQVAITNAHTPSQKINGSILLHYFRYHRYYPALLIKRFIKERLAPLKIKLHSYRTIYILFLIVFLFSSYLQVI